MCVFTPTLFKEMHVQVLPEAYSLYNHLYDLLITIDWYDSCICERNTSQKFIILVDNASSNKNKIKTKGIHSHTEVTVYTHVSCDFSEA